MSAYPGIGNGPEFGPDPSACSKRCCKKPYLRATEPRLWLPVKRGSLSTVATGTYRFRRCEPIQSPGYSARDRLQDVAPLRAHLLFPDAIGRPPGSKRQVQKRLLDRRDGLHRTHLIKPSDRLAAQLFDLARQLVADRPRCLDLAPHAGRDLQGGSEALLEPLGRGTGGHRSFGVTLKQIEDILSSQNSGIRQFVCVPCNRLK